MGFIKGFIKSVTSIFDRLSAAERINFARHLSMVIRAGLPLLQGMKMLQKQKFSKTLSVVLVKITEDINNGKFLSDSLANYPNLFNDFFTSIIRVGESSGTLSQNLLYLADEIKKDKELKSKVRAALIYPMVLLTATIAVVGFLTFFVFPKILPVLSGFNVELPATTRMLIAILDFSKAYGVISVIILFFLLLVGRYVYRSVRPIRYFIHRNLLRAPVLGTLIQYVNIANFSRILGLLLKSGVHIVEAINITSTTFSNLVYRDAFAGSAEAIRRGESLATYLDKQPKIFPSLLVGIVSIGETTGNLEENLTYLAGHYMEETDEALKTLTTLLEPLLLVGMGLVVGFVALSIILPIYSLSQGVG